MGGGNCPYTQKTLFDCIESLQSIQSLQDCLIEIDRLPSLDANEFRDELATAIACVAECYERLKGGTNANS